MSNNNKLTPSRTVVTSFTPRQKASSIPLLSPHDDTASVLSSTYEEGDWILCIASSTANSSSNHSMHSPQSCTICCALSNGLVHVYDQSTLLSIASYTPTSTQDASTTRVLVTDIQYGPNETTIVSTGNDGSIVVKDLRQPSNVIAHSTNICHLRNNHHSRKEAALSLSFGYDGTIVAVSSDRGHIHFIDVRKMAMNSSNVQSSSLLLGTYSNSHRDAITQVVFHPYHPSILLSGGDDGLVCVYNTVQPSEEQAIVNIINTGIPCRRVGFCNTYNNNDSGNNTTIYCLSGSETVGIWNVTTGSCINDFHQFQLRDKLSSTASIPIQYLVDATWDSNNQNLYLCGGNHEGNMAVFKYCPQRNNNYWELNDVLMGGHHGIVRSWLPTITTQGTMNEGYVNQSVYFTAGEDARMCEWNRKETYPTVQSDASPLTIETTDMETGNSNRYNSTAGVKVGGPIRRQRRSSKTFAKPY